MAYRKPMSRGKSRRQFRKGSGTRKINYTVGKMGHRGGIRL